MCLISSFIASKDTSYAFVFGLFRLHQSCVRNIGSMDLCVIHL